MAFHMRDHVSSLLFSREEPLFHKSSSKCWVLVNKHDFSLLARDTFADLLLPDTADQQVTQHDIGQPLLQTTPVFHHRPQHQPGRKALHVQLPEIVSLVTDYIQLHRFTAESRRRSTVGNAVVVTLDEVRADLLSNVPGLAKKGISQR